MSASFFRQASGFALVPYFSPQAVAVSKMSTSQQNVTTTDAPSAFALDLDLDDATWILTASFIIFTMQTGFGMLESGCVSVKNEANIMMKNVVDVVFGGLTYWLFGFSLSFGTDRGSTPVIGVGEYIVDADYDKMGPVFATFMFQLSFATTATTIVSGTMAERCNFRAYCVFSMLNTIVYCVPARWIWGPGGFLSELGVIDIAGSGAVHLLGGVSGFVAAWMLGPRLGRYEHGLAPLPLGNPTACLVGLYILWWGWLAFNSGSTFGVTGDKWKFAARASVTTMVASIGGGAIGAAYGFLKPGKYFDVMDLVNPVLGALVAITAGCAVYHTIESLIVGIIGGIVVIMVSSWADSVGVDDPVGATAVHGFGGLWGMLAIGLFTEEDQGLGITKGHSGLFRGGGVYLLQVQTFACVCIMAWAAASTFILLWTINKFIPIRMEAHEELLGADFVEHLVRRRNAGISRTLSVIGSAHSDVRFVKENAVTIGSNNPTHTVIVDTISRMKPWKRLKAKMRAASIFSSKLKNMRRNHEQDVCHRRSSFASVKSHDKVVRIASPVSQIIPGENLGQKYFGDNIFIVTSDFDRPHLNNAYINRNDGSFSRSSNGSFYMDYENYNRYIDLKEELEDDHYFGRVPKIINRNPKK